jgi:two-component system, chemotaxis family, protein-glutamate methylesterase/glutaminase
VTAAMDARPPAAAPIGVVMVAGTRTRQAALERLVAGPGFIVQGGARDAAEARALVARYGPSVVLLDLELFGGGLDVIEQLMASCPLPIVVCGEGGLRVLGRRHLRIASRVPVITHPRGRLRSRLDSPTAPPAEGPSLRLVAIGASTGGPPALATVLGALPADLPAAVVVVQHMAAGFVEGLARWLDTVGPLPVVVAADGERLAPGAVYLAPAGMNLLLRGGCRATRPPPAQQFHVPGIDVTFTSAAPLFGPRAVGVLLTGMGRDGALGLRALRQAGAFTLGQDEATSVVWGMPGAAQALDAVDLEAPLPDLAGAIAQAVGRIETGLGARP